MTTANCTYTGFNGPTLIYPNGGEIITVKNLTITWLEPDDIDEHSNIVWHEILFTDSYSKFGDTKWRLIASVHSLSTALYWEIPISIKSNNCRIGIRSVNSNGFRSKISISAANFIVKSEILPKPAIIEPLSGKSYFEYVPIVLSPQIISGKFAGRAFYNVFYMSDSLGIDWTAIKTGVPITQSQLYWDVSDLSTADDYVIKIEVYDNNTVSEPAYVRDVRVNSLNYFIIDTLPPVGEVEVLDTSDYINYRSVSLKLNAADETTKVQKYRLEQEDVGSVPASYTDTPFYNMSSNNVVPWQILGNDGVKLIKGRFVDTGGNTLLILSTQTFFRNYKTDNNKTPTTFIMDSNNDVWSAFGETTSDLFYRKTRLLTLSGEATSMSFFNDVLYIGIKDSNNLGSLLRYANRVITIISSFSTVDSVINSMVEFDDKLFMGLQNGRIYAFNGSTSTLINADNIFTENIVNLSTNNGVVFVFLENSLNYWIISKSGSDYSMTERIMES